MTHHFQIQSLNQSHAKSFLSLQSEVRSFLIQTQKHYLKDRTEDGVLAHVGAGMPLVGVFNQHALIGAVMVTHPDHSEARYMDGYPFDPFYLKAEESIVIQSLLVSPSCQGMGISSLLIAEAVKMAGERSNVVAKTAASNKNGMQTFLNNGFSIAVTGVDPAYGHEVVYPVSTVDKVLSWQRQKQCARLKPLLQA